MAAPPAMRQFSYSLRCVKCSNSTSAMGKKPAIASTCTVAWTRNTHQDGASSEKRRSSGAHVQGKSGTQGSR